MELLATKTKSISYQAGLRAEWTDVKTTLAGNQPGKSKKLYEPFSKCTFYC